MNSSLGPWVGRIHALTVLLGAFLLFQVQPLLSKWILPWFGGGPAVWTTCLFFFQSALFVGYAYAHLTERWLPIPWRSAAHLALILAAAWLLPIAPGEAWKPAGPGDPTGRILLLLGIYIGAPYVLLSSTGPLVQAWFSRAYPDRSPYRLYALSNAGSLAALLSYPFLFEPLWGLRAQSILWTWLFLGYAALYAVGAIAAGRAGPTPGCAPVAAGEPAPPTGRRVGLWIGLSAFASWMLLATTHQLCQDVAVIPFLWILPLAAYLFSFIVAFDHPRWYKPRVLAPWTAALVLAAAVAHVIHVAVPSLIVAVLGLTLAALFGLCMLCHGQLARLKPAPRHLTGYYLAVSGGGALGGLFVGLVAPQVFSTLFEWKLGMMLAYVGAWGGLAWAHRARMRAHRNTTALLLVIAATGLAFLGLFFGTDPSRLEGARGFYGVVSVEGSPGGIPHERSFRDLMHGRIRHGRQYLHESRRSLPTAYFVGASGIGRAMALFRSREDLRVGVAGLGIGTLAAYGVLPTQSFRFYEINPEVIRLAEKHFTYLKDCRGRVDVIPGDARLSLEREPPQGFHVLALDAFSGDSIPTHLLTTEAMGLYLRHLAPDGVLAFQVSNRYLELAPVVRGTARRFGLKTVQINVAAGNYEIAVSSHWILCTRNDVAHGELSRHAAKTDDAREIVWTDDFSDLFTILKWR